ncbi:MAG TPA: hypothetical protein VGM38_00495, partial [Pseudolysinimonas sp.]
LKTLRRSEDSEGFLFFTAEQRAIGELMLSWEVMPESGIRIPHVQGYAGFVERYRDDPEFRSWFAPVDSGMALVSKGDNRRLIDIQRALVLLIDELDPKRKYTAGYDLQPIDPDDANTADATPAPKGS